MSTYYVGTGGNNANAGTSWALRKLTLNGAEDIPVAAGDTVYVGPGTYRETLTVDVSGSAGNQIAYIGDYTGANTDGTGGMVRITGSDNDQTATRANCVTATGRTYRTFRGFALDGTTGYAIASASTGAGWIVDKCAVQDTVGGISIAGDSQSAAVLSNLLFNQYLNSAIYFSGTVTNSGHVVENCIFNSGMGDGSYCNSVGGVLFRNCLFMVGLYAVRVAATLPVGYTPVTVNNSMVVCTSQGFRATALGELVENYNTFYGNVTRTSVATGANSNSYLALFDQRWFFQLVNSAAALQLVTPFDLASYSQIINVAGTSPTTTDMRGTSAIGGQREWGALEYDSALDIMAGTAADYPSSDDVRDGTVFSIYTGNMTLPAVADVQSAVTYGTNGTELTGTFTEPGIGNVEAGVTYGGGGTEFTGTFGVPAASDVALGVTYGAGGTEFTGELAGGAPDWTAGEKEQIRKALGITGATAATTGTGTLEAAFAALATDSEIATAAAAAILVTPANKLATGAAGVTSANVTYLAGQSEPLDNLVLSLGNGGLVEKLNSMLEAAGADYRFTAAALAEAPTGAGTGLYSDTITVRVGGVPVDGALVQVATDSAFTNIVRSGYTNSLGQVTFLYDALGTYYGRADLAGYNIATFTITVSA